MSAAPLAVQSGDHLAEPPWGVRVKPGFQPDLLWDLDLYARLARADAWAFIGPINWYGPHLELQAALRPVCLHEWRESPAGFDPQEEHCPRPSSRAFAPPVEKTVQEPPGGADGRLLLLWRSPRGDLDARVDQGYSLIREWFDPKEEPYDNERDACEGLVWQCRYSGIEVPDSLWSCADIGVGKLYADDQADALESEPAALAAFDESTHRFTQHVGSKGNCRGCRRCCPRSKVHHPIIVRQPTHPGRDKSFLRNFFRGISVFRVERRKGPWLDTPSPHPTT